jgi:two-component system sensor histidine kinase VicK
MPNKQKKPAYNFNFINQCQEEGLRLWECPPVVFILTGIITLIFLLITYFVVSFYYSPDVVLVSATIITGVMMVISFIINQSLAKIIEAKRGLRISNQKLTQAIIKIREQQQFRKDFTAMIAHDVRTSLKGIVSIAELLADQEREMDPQVLSKSIKLIKQSTYEALDQVTDMLEMEKIDAEGVQLVKKPMDINILIRERVEYFILQAKQQGININITRQDKLPLVKIDCQAISRIIDNLITNALKYTEQGGRINIQFFLHKKKRDITAETKKNDIHWLVKEKSDKLSKLSNSIIIAITDNGIGIPKADQTRLFNRFKQARQMKETPRGFGLGLTIAKNLIEAHGGIIDVESSEGQGSTFFFSLHI